MGNTELKEIRKKHGYSQQKFADILQTPFRTYQDRERNVYPIPDSFALLVKLVDISIDEDRELPDI